MISTDAERLVDDARASRAGRSRCRAASSSSSACAARASPRRRPGRRRRPRPRAWACRRSAWRAPTSSSPRSCTSVASASSCARRHSSGRARPASKAEARASRPCGGDRTLEAAGVDLGDAGAGSGGRQRCAYQRGSFLRREPTILASCTARGLRCHRPHALRIHAVERCLNGATRRPTSGRAHPPRPRSRPAPSSARASPGEARQDRAPGRRASWWKRWSDALQTSRSSSARPRCLRSAHGARASTYSLARSASAITTRVTAGVARPRRPSAISSAAAAPAREQSAVVGVAGRERLALDEARRAARQVHDLADQIRVHLGDELVEVEVEVGDAGPRACWRSSSGGSRARDGRDRCARARRCPCACSSSRRSR